MPEVPDRSKGRLPDGTVLGPVTLAADAVADLARFYRDAIGLTGRGRSRDDGALELGTGEATLLRLVPATEGRRDPAAAGLFHLALALPDRATLGAWLRHALATRVPLSGAADHAVSEALYLNDPEGNGIEVYRDRPRDRWRTEGGSVVMTTEPLDADSLLAAAGPSWRGVPSESRVGHVHLQVAQLERSLAFYADALGWPLTNAAFPRARFLGAGGYHHHLGLNTWNVRPGARRLPNGPGLVRFEVVVPSSEDLRTVVRRLAGAGAAPKPRSGGVEVADPDGIGVRLRAANRGA